MGSPCIDAALGNLQDKQDKLTATTAKIRKNELWCLIGCGASIYLLSEANGPLFEVATLTGFEEATAINCIELQSTAPVGNAISVLDKKAGLTEGAQWFSHQGILSSSGCLRRFSSGKEFLITLGDEIPVDYVEKHGVVFRVTVLILQIIGMPPDIDAKKWLFPVTDR